MGTEDERTRSFDLNLFTTWGTDSGPRFAFLIFLAGSQAGSMYKIEHPETTIGRGYDANIRIEDDSVSRYHAKITRLENGSITVYDLKSTNGTFCNGAKIEKCMLKDGDKIQLGKSTFLKLSYQDSLEEEFQKQQYELAIRDSLTKCFNKRHFIGRLPSEFSFAKRHHRPISLIMTDIDFFKKVNDTYGHPAGDFVLKRTAEILQENIRLEDLLARYGGEEFVIIMRETNSIDAFQSIERIRSFIERERFAFEGKSLKITISSGIASFPENTLETPDELVRIADQNLYKAKGGGRNKTEFQKPKVAEKS